VKIPFECLQYYIYNTFLNFQRRITVSSIWYNTLAAPSGKLKIQSNKWKFLLVVLSNLVSQHLFIHLAHWISNIFFSGVVIDRELKRKIKPFTSRRILRIDYFTKPVLEQDSEDNVLAPLSLTHFGAFDKLSRYYSSEVKSIHIKKKNLKILV